MLERLRCTGALLSPNIRVMADGEGRAADKPTSGSVAQPHSKFPHAETGSMPSITVVAALTSLLSVARCRAPFLPRTKLCLRCLTYERGAGSPDPGITHYGRRAPPSPNILPRRRPFPTNPRTTTIFQPGRRYTEGSGRFPTDPNERCWPSRCRPERWTRRR